MSFILCVEKKLFEIRTESRKYLTQIDFNKLQISHFEDEVYILCGKNFFDVRKKPREFLNQLDFAIKNLKSLIPLYNLEEAFSGFQFVERIGWTWFGKQWINEHWCCFDNIRSVDTTKGFLVEKFNEELKAIIKLNDYEAMFLKTFHLQAQWIGSFPNGGKYFPIYVMEISSQMKVLLQQSKEILIIVFVPEINEDSSKIIDSFSKLREKNNNIWKDSVGIEIILQDISESSKIVEKINENKWNNVIHYYLGLEELANHEILIIDKQGLIIKDEVNFNDNILEFEEKIICLLKNEEGLKEKPKNETIKFDKFLRDYENDELLSVVDYATSFKFTEELKKINASLDYPINFEFRWEREIKFDDKMDVISNVFTTNPTIFFSIRKQDFPKISHLINQIEMIVPKDKCQYCVDIIETVNLGFGKNCNACGKELQQYDPQFYCYFCKIWLCEFFGNTIDETQVGSKKFLHPCNLVWIDVKNQNGMQNIDVNKFGKNVMFKEDLRVKGEDEWTEGNCVLCKNCMELIDGGKRYFCLSCHYGHKSLNLNLYDDLCHK